MPIERTHPGLEFGPRALRHRLHRGGRELQSQIVEQGSIAVAELKETNAAIGGADHHQSQRRLTARIREGQALAPAAIFTGRHAELAVRLLVNAAAGAEARL